MLTTFGIIVLILYTLGAYFFLIKKNQLGTDSIPVRVLFFVLSPFVVPSIILCVIWHFVSQNENRKFE